MLLIFSQLLFVPFSSFAVQESDDVSFAITATISEPAQCTINNSEDILVSFGDVDIDKIDGTLYQKQQMDINLICSNLYSDELSLQIYGPSESTDADLLDVPETPGLGIRFLYNNVPQPINRDFMLKYSDTKLFEAVLVKAPGALLAGGEFTASATLRVSYQ